MFYLSKRFGTLVNRFSSLHATNPQIQGSKLSFNIDLGAGHGVVEQMSGHVPRAVGKVGSEYVYTVANGLGGITGMEESYTEQAKGRVIEEIAKSRAEINIGLFNTAREMALRGLAERVGNERAMFLSYLVAHDTVGYGPISILLEDKQRIEEIEVNAPCSPINIFHVDYGRCATNLSFRSEQAFRHNLNKFIYETDKELGEDTPIIDAQVAEARVHAQIRPYALSGAAASIRLTNNKVIGFDYLARKGTADFDVIAYLWLAIDSGLNIVIAGPPASGKTTLMSALFEFVPHVDRVVTIEEDVNELKVKLGINNSVALYGSRYAKGTNTREQVINALRMRPDRLVVGEVRGEETRELFAGANLGVPFMTTMHSNAGGLDIIKKLMAKPMNVETRSLNSLDLALYMKHIDLSKRFLSDAYEYKWLSRAETERLGVVIEESDSVEVLNAVRNGKLAMELLPASKVVDAFSKKKGISRGLAIGELVRRAEFLKVLHEGCESTGEMLEKVQCYGL